MSREEASPCLELRRIVGTEGGAALFLLRRMRQYIGGTLLFVDGGQLACGLLTAQAAQIPSRAIASKCS